MPEAFFLWNSFPEACFVKRQSGKSRSAVFGKVANRENPEAWILEKSSIGKIPKCGFCKIINRENPEA